MIGKLSTTFNGGLELDGPIPVRHGVSVPVLVLLGALILVGALFATRPDGARFGVVGCNRDARLCTIFDGATGEMFLTPLPLYPNEAAPSSGGKKQEV